MASIEARRKADAKRRANQPYRKLFDHIRQSCRLKRPRFSKRMVSILGYDYEAFRDRIIDTLPDGMTWECFIKGLAHIDHIKPLACFDQKCAKSIGEAWALDNIRAVHPRVNMSKIKSDRKMIREAHESAAEGR